LSQGLKPPLALYAVDVRAEAQTYLRDKIGINFGDKIGTYLRDKG
jgi:hypothetical protein